MTGIVIRAVKEKDFEDIKENLFVKAALEDVKKSVISDIKRGNEDNYLRLVAVNNKKVVGQAEFSFSKSPIKKHVVEISGMVVNRSFQKKGISSKLMDSGLKWAKDKGAEIAILSVRKGAPAQRICEHMGFIHYGKLESGIKEPWGEKKVFHEILMYKQLVDVENRISDFSKDFDGWIEKKKACHYQVKTPPLFKERDIWWVSVGVNVGFEEDGKNSNFVRPILIVRKFNRELFLGIPMSTKLKDNKYYVPVSVKQKTVSVMISQLRVFSSKRMWNKLAELDEGDYFRVLEEVGKFFVLPFPQKREGRG